MTNNLSLPCFFFCFSIVHTFFSEILKAKMIIARHLVVKIYHYTPGCAQVDNGPRVALIPVRRCLLRKEEDLTGQASSPTLSWTPQSELLSPKPWGTLTGLMNKTVPIAAGRGLQVGKGLGDGVCCEAPSLPY